MNESSKAMSNEQRESQGIGQCGRGRDRLAVIAAGTGAGADKGEQHEKE